MNKSQEERLKRMAAEARAKAPDGCPFCGCSRNDPQPGVKTIHWGCGTFQAGLEPYRGDGCRVNARDELLEEGLSLVHLLATCGNQVQHEAVAKWKERVEREMSS